MLTIGLSVMMSETGTAPVGLGCAIGMPPKAAQVPTEITAAASAASVLQRLQVRLCPALVE